MNSALSSPSRPTSRRRENQRLELECVATQRGWQVTGTLADHRPYTASMLASLAPGRKACALGRRPTSSKVEQRIRDLRGAGMGILKIARQLGVGVSVVQRVVA
jgi:hypothetical protein